MSNIDPKTLVLQYLDEAHALELMLVTNLTAHASMTPEGRYRTLLENHLKTTQGHAEAIERRRRELGDDSGRGVIATGVGLVRDAVGQAIVLTKGPIDMVRGSGVNEKLLKNAKDECTTEAQEIATYDALEAAARAAGDETTAKLAAAHRKDEESMLSKLRSEIPRLAEADVEERTGQKAKTASSTTRPSSPTRKSATRRSATKKAGTAKSSGARSTAKASSTRSTAKSGTRSTGKKS